MAPSLTFHLVLLKTSLITCIWCKNSFIFPRALSPLNALTALVQFKSANASQMDFSAWCHLRRMLVKLSQKSPIEISLKKICGDGAFMKKLLNKSRNNIRLTFHSVKMTFDFSITFTLPESVVWIFIAGSIPSVLTEWCKTLISMPFKFNGAWWRLLRVSILTIRKLK